MLLSAPSLRMHSEVKCLWVETSNGYKSKLQALVYFRTIFLVWGIYTNHGQTKAFKERSGGIPNSRCGRSLSFKTNPPVGTHVIISVPNIFTALWSELRNLHARWLVRFLHPAAAVTADIFRSVLFLSGSQLSLTWLRDLSYSFMKFYWPDFELHKEEVQL